MSRIHLAGEGDAIPLEALPIPTELGDLPPIRLTLTEEGFDKRDFVDLGFTHFEVYCIGAAGGRGGAGYGQGVYPTPEAEQYPGYPGSTFTNGGGYNWPYFVSGGVTHWHDPFMTPGFTFGGGGGGGGLHRVAGALADLPDISVVVIGDAGDDAEVGHLIYPGEYTPKPPSGGMFPKATEVYDPPIITFDKPYDGEDGGYSSFNGDTAMASGGKGGVRSADPRPNYETDSYWWRDHPGYLGHGGEGGVGGRTDAGGGAAGSTTALNGQDGTWDGDVGSGGGGGHGGRHIDGIPWPGGGIDPSSPEIETPTSSGGQGSYSFSDTSVFGNRETKPPPVYGGQGPGGGGGGAKVGTLRYGSRALGFDPNGAVIIRVMKIV